MDRDSWLDILKFLGIIIAVVVFVVAVMALILGAILALWYSIEVVAKGTGHNLPDPITF